MALGDLADELQTLSLSEPEYLLFNPTGDKSWLRERFDDMPRYLFRVFTLKSDGTTDRFWVKSQDAKYSRASSTVDILSMDDDLLVARMLNKHLRWWGKDNLVSWTSSLLFALQYIFYRHTDSRDGSSMDKIYLCIVDTVSFPKGVFLRDMDLINAYCLFDTSLLGLKDLRTRKHHDFTGSFYFGEYLSQGALRIEGKCRIVSAQEIMDQRLSSLRPEFGESMMMEKAGWANAVLRLREAFYQEVAEQQEVTEEELRAAINIAQLFGPRWRLPIAANLIALLPRRSKDDAILQAFRASPFTGSPLSPTA